MQSKPAATNASSNENEVLSSAVQPKTLPPKTSGAISKPESPNLRFFTLILQRCFVADSSWTEHRGRGAERIISGNRRAFKGLNLPHAARPARLSTICVLQPIQCAKQKQKAGDSPASAIPKTPIEASNRKIEAARLATTTDEDDPKYAPRRPRPG
jgi:hypothetical protein